MAIYELTKTTIRRLPTAKFKDLAIKERQDLQRLLREAIDVIAPGTLVVAEEFGKWEDSHRRIDLLCIDKDANLVVVELKRTEDGGHMELQAIRYAAMVSTMTFDQVAHEYGLLLKNRGIDADPREKLLEFLEWDEPDDELFAQDARIVIASADFDKELTSSVLWLNERGLDIRCVRMIPHADGERVFLDVQQIIPLPEAQEYQVKLREKKQRERSHRQFNPDFTKYDVTINGEKLERLPKRRAVLAVVRHLWTTGVTPRQMAGAVSFKSNAFWELGKEHRDRHSFVKSALVDAKAKNRVFDERRYFIEDDELMFADGCTYALSNQWGGRGIEWIEELLAAFPRGEVALSPCIEAATGD